MSFIWCLQINVIIHFDILLHLKSGKWSELCINVLRKLFRNTCSSVQITTLHALLCNKHMETAYVFFSSSVDSAPFLCFLNFTNPSTIPSRRTTEIPPATSPPRKAPTVAALLPPTVGLDCSSAMGVTYNTYIAIYSTVLYCFS